MFGEARVLYDLNHPAVIRLRDCDYADAGKTRPYLVMDYFDGVNLDDHVADHGPPVAGGFAGGGRPSRPRPCKRHTPTGFCTAT